MRTMMKVVAVAIAAAVTGCMAGCVAAGGERSTVQAVAGPSVTVTPRAAGELAVSWTADATASRYQVFQSVAGGELTFLAAVFDSVGGPPPTSYIADSLIRGVRYCYAVLAVRPDGSMSELSAQRCAVANVGSSGATGSLFLPPLAFRCIGGCTSPAGTIGSPEFPNAQFVGGFDPDGGIWRHTQFLGAYEIETPLMVPVGTTIGSISAFFVRASDLGPDDQYVLHLVSRTLAVGAPPQSQIDRRIVVRGDDPSSTFPGLDSVSLPGLPITTEPNTVYVITWKGFVVDGGGAAIGDAFYGVGVTINDSN